VKTEITVREYARLTTEVVATPSLDRAQISVTAFDWLCQLSESFSKSGAALVHTEGRRWLCLDNYVGVIETPCGTCIEILPKHVEGENCARKSRQLLCSMIGEALHLPRREAGVANLELFDAPLSEWVIAQFLEKLDHLVKRGVRFDYCRVEEEQCFLRGQLDIVRQLRQPPGRQHHFHIRHDLFLADRPENRLLKSALERVCASTRRPDNWRLAHELRSLFIEVPVSKDIRADFMRWRQDRLMAHYQPIKPWCELILYRHMPWSVAGQWRGISLLFPMEKLFERYVAASLSRALLTTAKLTEQAARLFLCDHDGGRMFQLQPDLLIEDRGMRWVLDTKWKRIDSQNRTDKYSLSQADFYQLFAYGQKYLQGRGELVLIYPRRAAFQDPLPVFEFNESLRLWVLPFDLERRELIGVTHPGLPLRGASVITGMAGVA
jgi:5-methylcytosine-specific restriction enzyme subunit McrC